MCYPNHLYKWLTAMTPALYRLVVFTFYFIWFCAFCSYSVSTFIEYENSIYKRVVEILCEKHTILPVNIFFNRMRRWGRWTFCGKVHVGQGCTPVFVGDVIVGRSFTGPLLKCLTIFSPPSAAISRYRLSLNVWKRLSLGGVYCSTRILWDEATATW